MIYYDFRALLPINPSFVWLPDPGSDRVTITYSFPNSAPSYQYDRYGEGFANSFVPIGGIAEVQARRALQIWEEASAIDFIEVVGGPSDIVMGMYDFDLLGNPRLAAATAFAHYPAPVLDDYGLPGDIFFDFKAAENLGIWLHELGHALGLDHPFEGRILAPEFDNGSYTIMSYNAITDKETIGSLDVAAIQFLYGDPNSDPGPENSAMFRFLNTQTNVHFYTADVFERDAILNNAPHYKLEGPAFAVPETEGSLAVYRFYKAQKDVHFYTASEAERDLVIETLSDLYQYEGQAFNAWENQDAPGEQAALHRFYRSDVGTHFYTANHDEFLFVRDNLNDFSYEGVAYYVDL